MTTNIQWHAPAYKISILKIFIYLIMAFPTYFFYDLISKNPNGPGLMSIIIIELFILKWFYKKQDPDADYAQLTLYHKVIANYFLESDKLIIEFSNKRKIIYFDKVLFFTPVCPETNRFFSSSEFSILYFSLNKGNYKKYIPIFVPITLKNNLIHELSKYIKFYDKQESQQKIKSNLLKYFSYILIGGIILFFIIIFTFIIKEKFF